MISVSKFSRGTIGVAKIVARRKTSRFITFGREATLDMAALKTCSRYVPDATSLSTATAEDLRIVCKSDVFMMCLPFGVIVRGDDSFEALEFSASGLTYGVRISVSTPRL